MCGQPSSLVCRLTVERLLGNERLKGRCEGTEVVAEGGEVNKKTMEAWSHVKDCVNLQAYWEDGTPHAR